MLTCLQSVYKCLQERINMRIKHTFINKKFDYEVEYAPKCVCCRNHVSKLSAPFPCYVDRQGYPICYRCATNNVGYDDEIMSYTKNYFDDNSHVYARVKQGVHQYWKKGSKILIAFGWEVELFDIIENSSIILADNGIRKDFNLTPPLEGSLKDMLEWVKKGRKI